MQSLSDKKIITAVRGDALSREAALEHLFKDEYLRRAVTQHVVSQGGSYHDAQDIFQDTLVLFDRNIRQGRFEERSSIRTYFIGIAKWHWFNTRQKKQPTVELMPSHYDEAVESPEAHFFNEEKKAILEQALAQLSERCRELLKYYRLDYSLKEMAEIFGFSSPEMAKKEAYRCRERLRTVFIKNPHLAKVLNIFITNEG